MTSTTISFPASALRLLGGVLLAGCLALGLQAANAQSPADVPPDMVAPPRLAVVEGAVQFWRPGAENWVRAQLNAALAPGDAVHAGDAATVEIQVGPRDFVRLTANTMLTLEAHDAGLLQYRVGSGVASFDLRSARPGQVIQIDTPNANIVIGGRGYYRVTVNEAESRLIVRNGGRATLTVADGRSQGIGAGEEIVVQGGAGARIASYPAPLPDSWDRWNDARSEYYAAATSNRYVPADAYGAADLDQYGRWQEDGTYGWIWVPAVAAGWAPYSTGSWQMDPIYGWTWIDVAPWGWTTSHYGRWVFIGGHWAWAPGPRTVRAAYAPALVAFGRVDGGVSWVALGWGEPLVPWWGRTGFRGSPWWGGWGGPRATVHIDNYAYRNRNVNNAVIGVREEEFGRHHVRGSSLPLPPGVEPRPIRGDHPIGPLPGRAPAMGVGQRPFDAGPQHQAVPPAQREQRDYRGLEQAPPSGQQPGQSRTAPQERPRAPMAEPLQRTPQIIMPTPRQPEAAPRPVPMMPVTPVAPREQREPVERTRPEPRLESRPAPVIQPRIMAPAAPVPAAPAPEVRIPPQREFAPQRERREERGQREMQRIEAPRIEAPRPQVMQPPAPEAQRRDNRERFDHRGRPRGPGDRD
jgi:hypothetical protein